MVDDRSESGTNAEPGRPRREPPTIDLTATNVSEAGPTEETAPAEGEVAAEADPETAKETVSTPTKPVSPWAIAPISGAVAAALVIGVGWVLGWPAVQAPAPAVQLNASAIDDLTARLAGLESRVGKPVADPAAVVRIEQVEKAVAALRSDLAAARAQSDRLSSAVDELKALPKSEGSTTAAAPADLAPLSERLAQIERAAKAQDSEIAAIKAVEAKLADGKPADDTALRRVVAASLLDLSVRQGDPFETRLATARSLATNPGELKPLDAFAASGVPSVAALCRELTAIVPKLAPTQETQTTGGIVDRLQAGATKLVRIQRADATGTDRASIVARITAAALRNDLSEARRELMTLAPADRTAAAGWLERADARDAALAASRKFASDAMGALAPAR